MWRAWYPTPVPSRFVVGLLAAAFLSASWAGPVHGESQRWVVVPGKSQVGFGGSHPLGAFSGKSEAPAGEFRADIADLKPGITGALTVEVATLRTGEASGDRNLRRALDAERHPEIRYTIQKVESSFPSLAENVDVLLTIRGLLSIRGVDRVVTFLGRVRLREGTLWVRGEAQINMSEFGVPRPRRWLLQAGDPVLVSFDLVLTKAQ